MQGSVARGDWRMKTQGRNRWIWLALALALLTAACGGGGESGGGAETSITAASEQEPPAGAATDATASPTAGDATEASGEPVRIGAAVVTSGPAGGIGKDQQTGMQIAVDELNAGGGVLGRPVQIVAKDTGGDPTKAAQVMRQLVDQEKVPFVFGPSLSSPTLAAAPIANNGTVLEFTSAAADDARDASKLPLTFGMEPSASLQAETFLDYMQSNGWTKPGLLAVNNALGTFNVDKMKASAGDAGVEIAGVEFHETGSVDLTPQVQKLKSAGADVLVLLEVAPPDMIAGLKARTQLGWNVPVLGFSSLTRADVRHAVGGDGMDQVYAGQQYEPFAGGASSQVDHFLSLVKEHLGTGTLEQDVEQVVTGYDAVQMWAHGVNEAGTTDPEELATWLEGNGYDGVKASYEYGSDRHDGVGADDLVFVVADSFDDGVYELAPNQG